MTTSPSSEICQRIAQLRLEVAGARGKSSFAKQLGLSPSTYDYYEASRVPPADVLVRIADLTGADLRWLLTGQASAGPAVPAGHPVLRRAADLLAAHADSAKPLGAFLDILAEAVKFPAKVPADGPPDQPAAPPTQPANDPKSSWIPVLGRSAAGVPRFWSDRSQAKGLTTLEQLVARHAGQAAQARARRGLATGPLQPADAPGQLISLSEPAGDSVAEFLDAQAIRQRYDDAFALWIDGDSMAPDINHGDLVILSPSAPATDGRPAVVQLADQIGVTCKLYRRGGDTVHLVPLNEHVPAVSVPADRVVWALRVLARVRV
jgi:transcriptional regulator with XRE-family HTH domain